MATEKIKYTITFLSDWHAGSGLGSGADADAVVIKDKDKLPCLPGKTIKGLLKDAITDIMEVQPKLVDKETITELFGEYVESKKKSDMGSLFFSNAELGKVEKQSISKDMSAYLYRNIVSTKIDENGVAKEGSLRTMQVCIPVVLEGYIDGLSNDDVQLFELAFRYLRHVGVNRNRGLGRCRFEIKTN